MQYGPYFGAHLIKMLPMSTYNAFVEKKRRKMGVPRPDFTPNIGHLAISNERQLFKMVYIIPKLLVLHFGDIFIKNQT